MPKTPLTVTTILRPLAALFLLACSGVLHAQTRSFPTDQAGFLAAMTDFLVEADKKDGKEFMELQFTPVWNGGYYSDPQRVRIAEQANYLLKKRFTAFPQFRDYLVCVMAFAQRGRASAELDTWLTSLEALEETGRKKNTEDFLDMSTGLFRDMTLYQSASTHWRGRGGDFTFAHDSVPKVVFQPMDLV
ncbi:MAG: hypothetical protein KDB77_03070, partial [Flavobacteriales bacterium]|nr:hypothetical protein [Flavobacteriales bacterium]